MEFSVYQTVFTIVLMLGNAVNLMVLSKFCKLDDALMGIMSTISRITSAFIFGLAPTEAIFYSGKELFLKKCKNKDFFSKLLPTTYIYKTWVFWLKQGDASLCHGHRCYSFAYGCIKMKLSVELCMIIVCI